MYVTLRVEVANNWVLRIWVEIVVIQAFGQVYDRCVLGPLQGQAFGIILGGSGGRSQSVNRVDLGLLCAHNPNS